MLCQSGPQISNLCTSCLNSANFNTFVHMCSFCSNLFNTKVSQRGIHIYSLEDNHWDSGKDQVHDTVQKNFYQKVDLQEQTSLC